MLSSLDFEAGAPQLSFDRLKAYWEVRTGDKHSKQWYRRYRDMAGEFDAWLTGKRLFENPDKLLTDIGQPLSIEI